MPIDAVIEYATLHIVTIVTFFLAFGTIAHMLSQRKKPSAMIAWTVVIIAIPYIGILLYLILNGRKFSKNARKKTKVTLHKHFEIDAKESLPLEQFYRNLDIAGATDQNAITLFSDAKESFDIILNRISEAKESIYISTYIFGKDTITKKLLNVLTQKAQNGVEVKLLIDSIGSLGLELSPTSLQAFKNAGGEYQFFMSMIKHPIANRLNLRNHRKMILIDSHIVISGGINLSKEYLADDASDETWKDLAFEIQGAAVLHYLHIFQFDWESQSDRPLKHSPTHTTQHTCGKGVVQVIPSGPDVPNDALYESILYALFLAQKRIWIVTPYFVPDGALMDALIIAKHRGIEIKIILPDASDHFFADISRNGFLRELEKESIEILRYTKTMLHAKAMLIDEQFALIGSSNFDARSFFYNFEVMSAIYSYADVKKVDRWITSLFDSCEIGLADASKPRILIENIFKMLSPAL